MKNQTLRQKEVEIYKELESKGQTAGFAKLEAEGEVPDREGQGYIAMELIGSTTSYYQ